MDADGRGGARRPPRTRNRLCVACAPCDAIRNRCAAPKRGDDASQLSCRFFLAVRCATKAPGNGSEQASTPSIMLCSELEASLPPSHRIPKALVNPLGHPHNQDSVMVIKVDFPRGHAVCYDASVPAAARYLRSSGRGASFFLGSAARGR